MDISPFVAAGLSLVSAIIGASLQYLFSRSSETHKQLATLRSKAYVDYLRCVAELARIGRSNRSLRSSDRSRRGDLSRRSDLLSQAADAKARICIYGTAPVIAALSAFEKKSPVIDSESSAKVFLTLVKEMRRENIGRSEAARENDLSLILFGPEEWPQQPAA
jgi:hypothetical protein